MKIPYMLLRTLILLLFTPSLAQGLEQRSALIIGNSTYQQSPLKNPINDSTDIAAALSLLGFDVYKYSNLNQETMLKVISDFGSVLKDKGGVGFFYFAGHGMEIGGRNYLLPVDVKAESETDVVNGSIETSYVINELKEARSTINIVMLDACRNNPFARSFRSTSRGLARIDGPTGSIVAYSTSPGSVAADGTDRNGLYTKYFLRYVIEPGLTIEEVFKKVRIAVENDTRGKQVPWESSSLKGDFYFIANQRKNNPEVSFEEQILWDTVRQSEYEEDIQFFKNTFPDSIYSVGAQFKLEHIRRQKDSGLYNDVDYLAYRVNETLIEMQGRIIKQKLDRETLANIYFLYKEASKVIPQSPKIQKLQSLISQAYIDIAVHGVEVDKYFEAKQALLVVQQKSSFTQYPNFSLAA